MTIGSVKITVKDPGLPKASANTTIGLGIGTASQGSTTAVKAFNTEDAVRTEYGSGPLVSLLVQALREGGAPVYGLRAAASVAASNGTVTQSGTGPLPVLSGTAVRRLRLQIVIVAGGAVGTSTFKYSLDGGITYGQTRATVASFVIPNTGVTVAFTAGTYVANETYTALCAPAYQNSTDLTAAQTAMLASGYSWDLVALAGIGGVASAQATLFSSLDTLFQALDTACKYRGLACLLSAGSSDAATTATSFPNSLYSAFVGVARGIRWAPTVDPIEGLGYEERACHHDIFAKQCANLISTDLVRTSLGMGDTKLDVDGSMLVDYDEFADAGGLDDLGISCYRTWRDKPGLYFSNARIKTFVGSDLQYLTRRIVLNKARSIAYTKLVDWVGRNLRTNKDDVPSPGDRGTLAEIDAASVDDDITEALRDGLRREKNADGFYGHVQAVRFTSDRHYNSQANEGLQGTLEIVPLLVARTITATIGYVRVLGA